LRRHANWRPTVDYGNVNAAAAEEDRALGFTLPLSPLPPDEQLVYAVVAAELGYESCWFGEGSNDDTLVLAGAVAARTDLAVATGIVPVYNRTPMILAMAASTLSRLTGGRFVLGLGASTKGIIENWNGVPHKRPLARMRETIHVIRELFSGDPVTFSGDEIHVHRARLEAPPEVPPKIHIAALNRRMLELSGEVADGVIINLLGPEHVPMLLEDVAAGAAKAGRSLSDVEVVARLQVALDIPREEARTRSRSAFGPYVAASGYNRFFRRIGFESEADLIAAAMETGDREGVAAGLSDRLADALLVSGSAEQCRRRFSEYRESGVDRIVLIPQASSAEECWAMLRTFAPAGA
jgi:probable F420-dependent oxidoreductase